jgi:hypothetical protein
MEPGKKSRIPYKRFENFSCHFALNRHYSFILVLPFYNDEITTKRVKLNVPSTICRDVNRKYRCSVARQQLKNITNLSVVSRANSLLFAFGSTLTTIFPGVSHDEFTEDYIMSSEYCEGIVVLVQIGSV